MPESEKEFKEAYYNQVGSGQNAVYVIKKVTYQCPNCQRIIQWPVISTAIPNLECACKGPGVVYIMQPMEIKEDAQSQG